MNRQQFQTASQSFIDWTGKLHCHTDGHLAPADSGALATLPIQLAIPKSAKVPMALTQRVMFHELTLVYQWRAAGMQDGSFDETRSLLKDLSNRITTAKDDAQALAACKMILDWGGDRNAEKGAMPFLKSQKNLLGYLNAVKTDLGLRTAVVLSDGGLPAVMAMNSMLTKIHALNSSDGLPIYDSRVAGAIATLVETWRNETGQAAEPLSSALSFPEVGGGGHRRSVRSRYPACEKPPILYYATATQPQARALRTAQAWASAKVRLGWLLSAMLVNPSPSGIRSLEACLFMAGYNCAGINK